MCAKQIVPFLLTINAQLSEGDQTFPASLNKTFHVLNLKEKNISIDIRNSNSLLNKGNPKNI